MPDTRRQAGRVASASVGTRRNQTPLNSDRIWRGTFDGLELSNGTVPDDDISIAAGICRDSSNEYWMDFSSAVTDKEINNTWAEGSGNGGKDDGLTIENDKFYSVHGLLNPVSGSVDAGISTVADVSAAVLLADTAVVAAGYTKAQLLGFIKTDGTADILLFLQEGNHVYWDASVQDIVLTSHGSGVITHTLASVPTGVRVKPNVVITIDHNAATFLIVGHGDISTLPVPDGDHHDLIVIATSSAAESSSFSPDTLTSTSAEIKTRTDVAATDIVIETHGWFYQRGS